MTVKCTMILGDCLEVMPALTNSSVQMCFADLPYAVTVQAWDRHLPLEQFWASLKTCLSTRCLVAASSIQPYTSRLVLSQIKMFRHEICWCRGQGLGFLNANRMPLRKHENIIIFAPSAFVYNPIMSPRSRANVTTGLGLKKAGQLYGKVGPGGPHVRRNAYPTSLLNVDESDLRHDTLNGNVSQRIHPTQKPVALLNWLIRTYSNFGDHVLDPVSGSGTTAVSAIQNGRNVTCIEKDAGYFEASVERVRKTIADNNLNVTLEVCK